jgi:hypothetical protein
LTLEDSSSDTDEPFLCKDSEGGGEPVHIKHTVLLFPFSSLTWVEVFGKGVIVGRAATINAVADITPYNQKSQ